MVSGRPPDCGERHLMVGIFVLPGASQLDRIGLEDEAMARIYPRFPDDPASIFTGG